MSKRTGNDNRKWRGDRLKACDLLVLGWCSAVVMVGVDTGVFLCVFAADEAVDAVTEALIGLGCFFGELLLSETVGPTDCERPTENKSKIERKHHLTRGAACLPFEIFLGLFWGLPFIGLP
jgi:hypothetical protein